MTRAGTGKTYASAFAMRELGFKRVLFLVHRSTIAKQALTSFRKVFEDKKSMGIVGAGYSDYEADYIFAMVETLHKADNLRKFDPEEFDCIVLDECHHATASSYKKIIDYFKPEFLLGLTATPERMDNQDVFKLFDTNVPFELRLRDAITNDLVVPFHYYGIRDSLVDYGLAKDQERKTIAQLASVEHCAFIKDKIEERRGAGKLKALAFCRNITHARMMAEELSEYYHTAYLTGKNSVGERIRAYNDLQDDNQELEILCTVDILNEGVDIPGCNMVLFLRPTDSSTVFIQQLGRGLRKYNNKEFVTVLDFIGNSYKRSVQIAFAIGSLAENFVMEKHLMRSLVKDNFTALELAQYGVHIQFDSESQQEIINYIEQENFNSISYLKKDYENFKAYINSEFPPKHVDFLNNDCAPDIMRFMQVKIKGRKTGCYYSFLQGIGETRLPIFSEKQIDFIKYVSSLLPLVRPHEFMVIRCIMETQLTTAEIYEKMFLEIPKCTNDEVEHTLKFMLKKGALIQNEGILSLNVKFDEHFKEYIDDLLLYGMMQYEENYRYSEKFVLWHNYRMEQVQLKLLKDPDHNQKGTYFYENETVIFASLKKDAAIDERLAYKDKFLTPNVFQWECENNISERDLSSLRMSKSVLLFIRKVDEEHSIRQPFIYIGEGEFSNERRQKKIDAATGKENITYLYDIPMKEELPEYLQYDFEIAL